MPLSPLFTVLEAECGIVRWESTTFSANNKSDSEIGDVLGNFPKPSPGVQGFPHPAFPRPDALPKPLKTLAGLGLAQVSCVVFNSCFHLYFSTHHSLDSYDEKRISPWKWKASKSRYKMM